MSDEEKCLIGLCRAGVCGQAPALPPDGVDFLRLFALAERHRVGALAADAALRHWNLPGEARGEARRLLDEARYMEAVQFYETTGLGECFAARWVDFCWLKGAHWRRLYPAPFLRETHDVDVLVWLEQWRDACRVMEERHFERVKTQEIDLHAVFRKGDVKVEMHRGLLSHNHGKYVPYFREARNKLIPGETPHQWRLSPTDDYLYLFVHMEKHIGMQCFTLRMLTDIHVLRTAGPAIDRERFAREAGRAGLGGFVRNMEELADSFARGQAPGPAQAERLRYLLSLAHLTKEECDYRVARRWLLRNVSPMALARRLFAPKAVLLSRYDDASAFPAAGRWLADMLNYYCFYLRSFGKCLREIPRARRRALNRGQKGLYRADGER